MPPHRLNMLRRFFQDYKMLGGQGRRGGRGAAPADAFPVIESALAAYSKQRRKGFAAK